jgi:hypothetical protein
MHLITGAIHQCNRILARQLPYLLKLFKVFLKLGGVAPAEFLPALGIVGKPFSQLGAGCYLLGPLIYTGRSFGEPAGP